MKFAASLSKSFCAAALLGFASSSTFAAVVFSDNFETGNFSKVTTVSSITAKWGDIAYASVSGDRAVSGSDSLKFQFDSTHPWSEARFDLGKLYPELWISYSFYVPSNYVHRIGGDGLNNKFLRLWGKTYDDLEKIGYSTWPEGGYSSLMTDWDLNGAGVGPKGTADKDFITAADLGKWMKIKIHVKAATSSQKGVMQIWKNGVLAINDTSMDNYDEAGAHAFRYGYLLGNANSGFANPTYFYIDDVVFATTEGDLTGQSSPVPSPPTAVMVQ